MPDDEEQPRSESQSVAARGLSRIRPTIPGLLRTRIVAGLLVIIPIWLTWVAVKFVFDLMTSATEPLAVEVSETLTKRSKDLKILPEQLETYLDYIKWAEPLIAVLLTLFFLYVLGLLTANVFGRRIIHAAENIVEKLPLVKTIYRSTKQIVTTLGGGQAMEFQRVVLVEFPRPGMKCIGFLTAVMKDMDTGRDMASIFISTTPNPTTGYMQIVPLEEVSETNWTVEEAVKLLMSGGILSPPTVAFDRIHPVQWKKKNNAKGSTKTADAQPADKADDKTAPRET